MTDIFLYGPAANVNDIILCDPTQLCIAVVSLPRDDRAPYEHTHLLPRGKPFRERRPPAVVVVAHSLMDNLVREYGVIHGREVYFAMEREAKGPFAPGNKYDVTARPAQSVDLETPAERVPLVAPPARKN